MGAVKVKKRCVVIGGGEMADPVRTLCALTPEDYVICADSGYRYAAAAGITPDLFVGDYDSLDMKIAPSVERLSLPTHKDVTDTHAALLEGLARGFSDFLLLGCMGGRFDHSFANLMLLQLLLDRGARGLLLYDCGSARLLQNGACDLVEDGGYVSIFPWGGEAKGVTLEGFEYPLDHARLTLDNPVGVSNHLLHRRGRVRVEEGTLLLLQVREQAD